jgi:hypothetical protein
MLWFAPSASKPHDKGVKGEQNPRYSHYNGLTTRQFNSSTRGLCAPEDASVAVCLLLGTELSFTKEVERERAWPWSKAVTYYKTARFRQVNQHAPMVHLDALDFPDGQIVLLTSPKGSSAGDGSAVAGGCCCV